MMPLAFDLISTFVMGSIFPVATTDRTMVPRSAMASRDSGISGAGPKYADAPHATAASASTPKPTYKRFLPTLVILCQTEDAPEMFRRAWPNSRYNAKLSPKVTNHE